MFVTSTSDWRRAMATGIAQRGSTPSIKSKDSTSFGSVVAIAGTEAHSLSVQVLNQKKQERKSLISTAVIRRRLISVRMSFTIVVAVASWFALLAALYFLRVLGMIGGR
jgi:hypothetical protein